MDGRAQATIRNWLMGAAAAGLLSPGVLMAQTGRPVMTTARQPLKPLVRKGATSGDIRQMAYQPAAGEVQVAESEIEQRLRELYERDGRQMPDINFSSTQPSQPAAQPSAARQPQTIQPQPTSTPRVAPAASRPSENRFTSFFKRLIPGRDRHAQQPPVPPGVPRPMPNSPQPVIQPVPQQTAAPMGRQPQQAAAPMGRQPQPAGLPPAIHAQPAPVIVPLHPRQAPISPSPAAKVAEEEEVLFGSPEQLGEATSEPQNPSESNDESIRIPALPAPETEDEFDADLDPEMDAAPGLQPAPSEPAEFTNDFPNPFAESSEATEEPAAEEPAAEAPREIPAEELSPYTGKTLDIEEPAPIPLEAPAEPAPLEIAAPAPELKPATVEQPADELMAAKMRRIIQRSDMKGLKGFCPVTLRDQRELADSRPDYSSTYRGQTFYFASRVAQNRFEQDPARYAPVAFGADVVVLTDNEDVVEGTLDYAAWYKGRLYLFNSQENHDKFVNAPDRYATPPGIE